MVKKQQYFSNQQQDSYSSEDKYQPDPRYNLSSDQDSQDPPQSFQQQSQSQQQNSQQVHNQLSNLQKEQERIKQQLKELPYGLILKQRMELEKKKSDITQKQNLKKKKFNKYSQNDSKDTQPRDKNAPKQMSIHKRPPRKSTKQKSIDPRFEDYAGSYNQDLAKKSFDFIPKIQEQQIATIRKTLDQSKEATKNSRTKKKLSEKERKILTEQYNKLTNQRRQVQLVQIEQQAKRNIRHQTSSQNNYRHRQNPEISNGFIARGRFKQQFEKVKQSRMSEEQRKEYFKKKEKKIFKNQQVDRNNMMYETSNRFKSQARRGQ